MYERNEVGAVRRDGGPRHGAGQKKGSEHGAPTGRRATAFESAGARLRRAANKKGTVKAWPEGKRKR